MINFPSTKDANSEPEDVSKQRGRNFNISHRVAEERKGAEQSGAERKWVRRQLGGPVWLHFRSALSHLLFPNVAQNSGSEKVDLISPYA